MTVPEIVKALGGSAALAAGMNLPGNGIGALRVRAWVQRKSIPAAYWSRIVAYSKELGRDVTFEVLASAHEGFQTEAA